MSRKTPPVCGDSKRSEKNDLCRYFQNRLLFMSMDRYRTSPSSEMRKCPFLTVFCLPDSHNEKLRYLVQ
jgi:hypothetical protein